MSNTENTIVLTDSDKTATALVATIKASVNGESKYLAYIEAHNVTAETVKDHALALAAFTYPHEKPVQKVDGKRTKFGNAVQMIASGLRRNLPESETEKATPDWERLLRQAAENAHNKGDMPWDTIATIVADMALAASETPDLSVVA